MKKIFPLCLFTALSTQSTSAITSGKTVNETFDPVLGWSKVVEPATTLNLTVVSDTAPVSDHDASTGVFSNYPVGVSDGYQTLNLHGPGSLASRISAQSYKESTIKSREGGTVNLYTTVGGNVYSQGGVWNLATTRAFDLVYTPDRTLWPMIFNGGMGTVINANVSGAIGRATLKDTILNINAPQGIDDNTNLLFGHDRRLFNKGDCKLNVNHGGSITGGITVLVDDTTLLINEGGMITGGEIHLDQNADLVIEQGGVITGGEQTFHDRARLFAGSAGTITGGHQTFKLDTKLWADTGAIVGGVQEFHSGSSFHGADNAITGGHQIFQTSTVMSLLGNLDKGMQTFHQDMTIELHNGSITGGEQHFIDFEKNIDQANMITGGTQWLKGDSVLRLRVADVITGGTQVLVDDSTLFIDKNNAINGSHIVLRNNALLDLSSHNIIVGSLAGDGGRVRADNGSSTLTLGQDQGETDFVGTFLSDGAKAFNLVKQGNSTQVLSGHRSRLTDVTVSGGTLSLASGHFIADNYTTQVGATTVVGVDGSALTVGHTIKPSNTTESGILTQEKGSTLQLFLNGDGSIPLITANQARLNGTITVGVSDDTAPIKSSELGQQVYTLIRTRNGLTGDINMPSSLDYLLSSPNVSGNELSMSFRQAWTEGGDTGGVGHFTLAANTVFEVDQVLADQTPVSAFASGWDGKSLVKAGDGLLILSAKNIYTGDTTVNGGTLRTDIADTLASSAQVTVNNGVLDLNQQDQQINQLSGQGGDIQLNGAQLTLNNATAADHSTFTGDITDGMIAGGSLVKTGAGSQILSGQTTWTGHTFIDQGQLILDGSHGGAQLTSNIIGTSGAVFSLQNGATLTGSIDPLDVNIDTASTWNLIADSLIDTLDLAGTIVMSDGSKQFNHLSLGGDYTGHHGLVVFNSQLNGDNSPTDKLFIKGNTAGITRVQVNNLGGSGAATINGLILIEVEGRSEGEFIQQGRIVAGAYDYSLQRGAQHWYLSSALAQQNGSQGNLSSALAQENGSQGNNDHAAVRRPEAGSYAANLAASNNLFITRLADRAGETAYIDPVTGQHDVTSLWMRHQGGQNRVHDHTGQLSTKAHHYVVQIGGNVVQDLQGWDIGVMAGYARSHSKTRSQHSGYQSSGTVNGYNLGVYATWYANKAEHVGPYVDTALQYSWFNNTVAGEGIARETYQSRGITASVEGGYTVKLAEIANAGYFIEPKAKAVWMGVKTGDRVESNGTHVSTRGEGNLQTQLGVKAFMQINPGKTHSFRPFIEANWVHNTRDVAVMMDGVTSRQAGNRDSAQFTLGAEGQLNRQFSLHGNVAHQVGSKGYQNSSVVLGGKYRF